MEDFEKSLRLTFLEEATQLLSDAEQGFLNLESNPNDSRIIDRIFRLAHNLKGSAKAVSFDELGDFMHEFESMLLKIKSKVLDVSSEIVDILLQANDLLTVWVRTLQTNLNAKVEYQSLLDRIRAVNDGKIESSASKPKTSTGIEGFEIFDDEPAVVAPKPVASVSTSETTLVQHKDDSIRVNLQHVDEIINDIGELVILQTVLKQQKHLIASPLIQKTIEQLGKITRSIQDSSMRLRMVPLQQTFQKMQRILRDTAKRLDKDIQLHISGDETALDKSFVDNLGDPLVHLIRNAADHGVEGPTDRIAAGKSRQGNIWLSAYHQSGKIVIEIRDDGKGIDPDKIVKVAKEKGLIAEDAVLDAAAARDLLFHPGFSTKNVVTDISGRGVGLVVVKTNIQQLKGEIQVDSVPGESTTFRLFLPLTLAIIDGMIIGVNNGERYILPIAQVHEIFEVQPSDLHRMGPDANVSTIRGKAVPLFHLNKVLGGAESIQEKRSVIITTVVNHQEFAFVADAVVSQQQVVIKHLGRDLKKIQGISGSAILGDGKAALILDLEEIVRGRAA